MYSRQWKCHLLALLISIHNACTFQLNINCHQLYKQNIAFITSLKLQKSSVINAQDITIPIIYEDERILAICKPPHIPHHDDPQTSQLGILSLLRQQQAEASFPYPDRLYGVHRLDRVTSGILLFAKDSETANELITKFRQKEVKKYYVAISGKKPKKKKQGWVQGRMVMGRRGSYKLLNEKEEKSQVNADEDDDCGGKSKSSDARGGYAKTRFYTAGLGNLELAYVPTVREDTVDEPTQFAMPKTAILFEPHTGKTHQLRVAAKAVGLPILGDERYGGGGLHSTESMENKSSLFQRTYLHASAIHFKMNAGYNVTICSKPPFNHLFAEHDQSKNSWNDVLEATMEKHCDCMPILDAMRSMLN